MSSDFKRREKRRLLIPARHILEASANNYRMLQHFLPKEKKGVEEEKYLRSVQLLFLMQSESFRSDILRTFPASSGQVYQPKMSPVFTSIFAPLINTANKHFQLFKSLTRVLDATRIWKTDLIRTVSHDLQGRDECRKQTAAQTWRPGGWSWLDEHSWGALCSAVWDQVQLKKPSNWLDWRSDSSLRNKLCMWIQTPQLCR